ncbi:hypothetical protein SEPCBS57363_002061 [Sporothrix epigloea]|uniref:WD repeat protein n=1 Tax=Sporothrix epigloea TaxID=1892477 RepID=A0ABP0DF05_9PEZI
MAAPLGAELGGRRRSQYPAESPYKNASNSSSSSLDSTAQIDAAQANQLQRSDMGSRVPRTPTSSDGQAHSVSVAPSTAAESPTISPQQLKVRKTQRASHISPALNNSSRDSVPQQQQQFQQLEAPQQLTLSNSVQSSGASANTSSIDPLSQHIFLRTNTDPARNPKLRAYTTGPDSPVPDASLSAADNSNRFSSPSADTGKDRRKGFLGRLSMRTGRKKEDANDLTSETGEPRDEGSSAHVFSSTIDSAGFIPHHKEPSRYIRVKAHHKKTKEFDRMFLAQELIGTQPISSNPDSRVPVVTVSTASQRRKKTFTGGAIWATEFSKDGKYLAAGGRDHIVRIWQVISTAEDRRLQEEEEAQNEGGADERLSAPVFLERPVQEFIGHTGEILDLSWSKNNFLLSTSMDKTVRLWHTSRKECLCTFKHKELVSKVAFHPKDDRFFLAGCLDSTLRLWSIPDKTVAFSAQLSDMITAVTFSPDGKMAIAGLLSGFCYLLETEGLKPLTQIHVRSSRGRNAKGSKITGVVPIVLPNSRPGDAAILVTSTDARLRLYNLRDKTLDCKFKGHEHASGQLAASFSDDGKYVIVGSEARKVFIWNATSSDSTTKDRYPCETFDAHSDVVTTAIFAPVQTRQLLGASGDPIYDLCNPPPITLMSLEETLASQSSMSNNTLGHGDNNGTSSKASAKGTQSYPTPPPRARPEESPAYIARSTHYDGNIIVTSDDTGIIKVFRQDCAATKRRQESWETSSSFKGGTNQRLVGRSGSIITRTSASSVAHSRRGSLSLPPLLLNNGSAGTSQIGGNQDSINRWRHGIEGNSSGNSGSRPTSLVGSGFMSTVRSERSISPNKTSRVPLPATCSHGLASDARKQPYAVTISSPLSPHFGQAGGGTGNCGGAGASSRGNGVATSASVSTVTAKPILAPPEHETTTAAAAQAIEKDDDTETRPSDDSAEDGALANKGKRGEDAVTEVGHDERDFAVPSTPTAESQPPSIPNDDSSHLDTASSGFNFFNLNRWKGIAGLRTSWIGSASNEIKSLSHLRESSSPVDDKASSDGEQNSTKPPHRRHKSLGMNNSLLSKSPLSKPEVSVGTAGSDRSAPSTPKNSALGGGRQSRSGRISTRTSPLPPAITIEDEDHHYLTPNEHAHSPYATRNNSIISRLSSEMTSTDDEGDGEQDNEGEEMRCTKCGGRDFKARRLNGVHRLQCSRCGKVYEEAK